MFVAISTTKEQAIDESKKLVSKKEMAEMLSVSINTLDRWRREGRISAIHVGKQVRFHPEEVKKMWEGEVVCQFDVGNRRTNKKVTK